MLQGQSEFVRDCLERAARAREHANASTVAVVKADYLAQEQRWLNLARSQTLGEQISRFLSTRNLPDRQPASIVPIFRDVAFNTDDIRPMCDVLDRTCRALGVDKTDPLYEFIGRVIVDQAQAGVRGAALETAVLTSLGLATTIEPEAVPAAPALRQNEWSPFLDIKGRQISLPAHETFGISGEPIQRVYLIQRGLVSLVVQLERGTHVETAMLGPGALVGSSCLAGPNWPNVFVTQSLVEAWDVKLEDFFAAIRSSPLLRDVALRNEQWLSIQAQQRTACTAKHDLAERLATWLVRAQDVTGWSQIPFTQETIATLLGTQRATVSTAMYELKNRSLIDYVRGRIKLLDRDGLEASACECCHVLRGRYDELRSTDLRGLSDVRSARS